MLNKLSGPKDLRYAEPSLFDTCKCSFLECLSTSRWFPTLLEHWKTSEGCDFIHDYLVYWYYRYYPGNSRSAFYPKMGISQRKTTSFFLRNVVIQDVFVLAHLGILKKINKWVLLRLEVWLRIDDFVQLFDTVYECRLALWSEQKNRQQDFPGAGGICQKDPPEKSNPELTQNASNRHKGDNCLFQ